MKPKNVIFSLVLILAVIALALVKWRVFEPRQKELFDRRPSHIVYTKHALCRMDCRHITKKDIDEVMQKGIINFSKSNPNDRPCPTYVLQGFTSGNENVRVIFAQCNGSTRVITCYNLKKDFECHCEGDAYKFASLLYKNQH